MDAYTLLGVAPGVDAPALKRAFRKLAMRWHPDRNGDPAAVEHFTRLRLAYQSLLDALEAQPEETHEPDPQPEAPPEPERPARKRGTDRRQELSLSVEEACLGCDRIVDLIDEAVCETCDGGGVETLLNSRLCGHCHGTGRLRAKGRTTACTDCDGRGYLKRQACSECGGSGRGRVLRRLLAHVPPGMGNGDELRLEGEGMAHEEVDGVRGDLRLRIAIAPHPLYTLEGRDLIITRPVSALRMLIGGTIEVPVPGGARRLELQPGSAKRRELRIEGAGLPGRRGRPAGALIVRLEPVLPESDDERVRELALLLERELASDLARHLPEVAGWEGRWLAA